MDMNPFGLSKPGIRGKSPANPEGEPGRLTVMREEQRTRQPPIFISKVDSVQVEEKAPSSSKFFFEIYSFVEHSERKSSKSNRSLKLPKPGKPTIQIVDS